MADTVDIVINDSSWTDITAGGTAGFITNSGSKPLRFIEAAIAPAVDAIVGHSLNPEDFVSYTELGAQIIFAKSDRDEGRVTVTPD